MQSLGKLGCFCFPIHWSLEKLGCFFSRHKKFGKCGKTGICFFPYMESLERKKMEMLFFFLGMESWGKVGWFFFQIWKVWTERYSWQKSWNLWKFLRYGSKVSESLDLAWGWRQQRGSLLLSSFLLPRAISTLCSRFHCCPSSLLIIRCSECWWAPAGFKISLSLIPLDYPVFGVLVSASRKGILCRCNWCKSVNMVFNIHKPQGLLGMGRRGERGYGGGGRGRFIYLSPQVITGMTPVLRSAAMRAILMFH